LSFPPHIVQALRAPGGFRIPSAQVAARQPRGFLSLFFLARKSGVSVPRPLAPACGRQGPHLRGFLILSCADRKSCAAVPCNARLPRTPLHYQSRTGVPSSAVYVVCLHEPCVPAFTSLCGAVPLPQFPPSTPPPPWHTPIKVRVLIVSPFPPAVTGGNGDEVEGEPALRGSKNCHSPRPLPIFTPTQGVFCSYGAPPHNCRTRLERTLWLSRKAESGCARQLGSRTIV